MEGSGSPPTMAHPSSILGERVVLGITNKGVSFEMKAQVAEVRKILCSVKRIIESGCEVNFGGIEVRDIHGSNKV